MYGFSRNINKGGFTVGMHVCGSGQDEGKGQMGSAVHMVK